jgi:hypothetical protein
MIPAKEIVCAQCGGDWQSLWYRPSSGELFGAAGDAVVAWASVAATLTATQAIPADLPFTARYPISGRSAITSPFTTVILGPDEVSNVTATGDILIELPATARA